MKVFKVTISLVISTILLYGCDLDGVAVKAARKFNPSSHHASWMVPHGKKVNIGDRVATINGTDECTSGLGTTYPCWKFSLIHGDVQVVTLSNGLKEEWQTQTSNDHKVFLVRPNGFRVIGL